MAKNILVLTGSPRKDGNSDRMAEAFIRGAQSAGHHAEKFETAFHAVQGCHACRACWSRGNACIVQDGFRKLEPLLEEADAIVFATPLYWFGFSAQLKAAIDKMNAYTVAACPLPLKIKECALMVCGADDEESSFAAIKENYRSIAKYMKWTDRGMLVIPGVSEKGDIDKTDALQRAEELGKGF